MTDQSVEYRRAMVQAAPTIVILLFVCVFGYFYARTWWWIVVFVFGALAAFTNKLYQQKAMQLRERLSNR